jgi:23S rRNA pseudouridine1911/1915/1917 synthase
MARINESWKSESEGAVASLVKEKLGLSVRQAKGLIDAGLVKINGAVATKHGQRVEAGDELHANFDPQLKYDLKPRPGVAALDPYEVLYEDTHLLFVNKPAGLLTVPTEGGKEPTLADAITDHYQRRGFKRFQLFIVHRIDRWTSGVLVFAKTPEALSGLKKMFELHKLQRVYKAILVGEIPENSGTLKGHLIEQAKTLRMRVVDPKKKQHEGAQSAITHYRVLERLPGHTVVEVKLETGRRNQIRVQFADRGYPLLGDQVYGQESELLDRQALHAELLGLKHPVTEETISVSAPLPKDMDAALRALRTQARVTRAAEGKKGEEGVYQPKETKENKQKRVARAKRYEDAPAREDRPSRGPRKDFGDRPSRPRTEGEDRPSRGPRKDFGDRPARPRKDFGDRPARPRTEGEDRPSRGPRKDFGDRPARPRKDFGDRPARPRAEGEDRPSRGPRKDGDSRSARPRRTEGEDRPRKAFGDRPRSGAPKGRPGAKPGPRKPRKG